MAEDVPANPMEVEEIQATERIEKMDYARLLFFQMNRVGFLLAQRTEQDNPVTHLRSVEWAVGALEAFAAPYFDSFYLQAVKDAVKQKEAYLADKEAATEQGYQVEVGIRFQLDKLGHLMRIFDRRGLLLKKTYTDKIMPRELAKKGAKGEPATPSEAEEKGGIEDV